MTAKNKYDWGLVREQIVAALRDGVPANFQALADHLNIPSGTLRSGLRREFSIVHVSDLMGALGAGAPKRMGTSIKAGENTLEISDVAPLVRTLDELLAACKVDLKVWEVRDYLVSQWQYGTREGDI